VTFDSPVQAGLDALKAMLAKEPRLLAEPRPEVMVTKYTDRGIALNARYWTSNDDFWNVQFGFFSKLKPTLEAAGCRIAVPVQEVHVPEMDEEALADGADGDGKADRYDARRTPPRRPN
jgi:small-conductance mechanosensitive channel